MGWFDGPSSKVSASSNGFTRRHTSSRASSRSRTGSPSRRSGYSTYHKGHSAPSIFSLGRGGGRSSPSVFSTFSSSSRRARPREGFVQRMIRAIKKLFRDIYRYAREHPMKVLMLVVLPLLTSGVLPKLLAMIGIRLPHGVMGALGGSSGARGMGGMESKGLSESVNSLMSLAKMFA
ncbi:uncharacterized protein N7484_003787 [Penicillium longicatenatum]|uniref:uncharacterized protein n=1 Tax=Penicillium longicatenatum TaxID=1561947 RepID=UPI002548DC47|nr:uncharacterized protein N7484_003787 [Penicillium longicatenatum]KAJ5650064.1 hypothetical protein N7484_003787 [Penicillium longicatenatum]